MVQCGTQYLQAPIPRTQIGHLKKEVLSRYTPYLKPDVAKKPTKHMKLSTEPAKCNINRCSKKFLTNVGSVPTEPPKDIFDSDLSTCSFDNVPDVESFIPETTKGTMSVSSTLTSTGFNPLLTLCKLPAVLITSNVKLVSGTQSSTSQHSDNTKYLQVPQSKTRELKTADMSLKTQYRKEDCSVSPAQITNSLSLSMDTQSSTSQYPESMHYLQVQIPQGKTCDLKTEDASHLTEPNDSVASTHTSNRITLPIETQCGTSQYPESVQYLQVQLPQGEAYDLQTKEVPKHTQYLKTDDDDAADLITNGMTLPINSQCSQYPADMQYVQVHVPQEETCDLKTDESSHQSQYQKADSGVSPALITSNMRLSVETQSATSQYAGRVQYLRVQLPQGDSCVLRTEDTSNQKQYQNTDTDVSSNLTTSSFDFATETQCSTSQYSENLHYLQVQVPQDDTCDLKIKKTSHHTQYQKTDDVVATTLTGDNLRLPMEIQCSTPQYPDNVQYLQVQVSQDEANDLKTENEQNQYQKRDGVVASNLTNNRLSLPMEIESNASQYLESIQYLQVQAPQDQTCDLKTEGTAGNAQYEQTDNGVPPTQSTPVSERLHSTQFQKKDTAVASVLQNNIFDSDLSTYSLDAVLNAETRVTQHDIQSEVIPVSATQTSDSLHTVLNECDFPVGLISSSVNLISNAECNSTQYGLQDLQEEVAQREGYILTTETSQCDLQYINPPPLSFAQTLTSVSADLATQIQTICGSSNMLQTWTSQEISDASDQNATKQQSALNAPSKSQVQPLAIIPKTVDGSSNLPQTGTSQEIHDTSEQVNNMAKTAFITTRPIFKIQVQPSPMAPEKVGELSNLPQIRTSQAISDASPRKHQVQAIFIPDSALGSSNLSQIRTSQEISSGSNQITNMPRIIFTAPRPTYKLQMQTPTIIPDQTISKPQTTFTAPCPPSKSQMQTTTIIRDKINTKTKTSKAHRPPIKSQEQITTISRGTVSESKSPQTQTSQRISNASNKITTKKETRPPRKVKPPPIIPDLDFRFLVSPRGKRSLLVNSIIYRMTGTFRGKVRWRCSTHERFGCTAVVHTADNKIVYITNEHVTSSGKVELDPHQSDKKSNL